MRPKALDLFAGAGGVSMGLYRAGFDVVAVDIKPQRHHPAFHKAPYAKHFSFLEADALAVNIRGVDFVWASPPCQKFTKLRWMPDAKEHPDLIPETRERLITAGLPYCIENVEDAPLGESGFLIMLCGTMFGLRTPGDTAELWRHRLFETSFSIPLRPACQHRSPALGVYGGHVRDRCRSVPEVICVAGGKAMSGGMMAPAGFTHKETVGPRRAITITGGTPQTNLINNRIRQTFSVNDARAAMGIDWMPMAQLSQAIPPIYAEWIGKLALEAIQHSEFPGQVAARTTT